MARLQVRTKSDVDPKTRSTLEGIEQKMGKVPNLMGTMANAPAALNAYLGLSTALAKGELSAKLREQIALAVSQANGCDYCVSAHSTLGRMAGLSDEDIADSRRGSSPDRRTEAVLRFALQIVDKSGFVSDDDIAHLRDAGFEDGDIAEIVANVALSIFTNYFNHVAQTDVDFPKAARLEAAST